MFALVRRAHAAALFHGDLHWRNILVRDPEGDAELWWIDCPRFHRATIRRQHAILVDLSCLSRLALSVMSLRDRYRSLLLIMDNDRERARVLMREIDEHHRRSRHPPRVFDPARDARSTRPQHGADNI